MLDEKTVHWDGDLILRSILVKRPQRDINCPSFDQGDVYIRRRRGCFRKRAHGSRYREVEKPLPRSNGAANMPAVTGTLHYLNYYFSRTFLGVILGILELQSTLAPTD